MKKKLKKSLAEALREAFTLTELNRLMQHSKGARGLELKIVPYLVPKLEACLKGKFKRFAPGSLKESPLQIDLILERRAICCNELKGPSTTANLLGGVSGSELDYDDLAKKDDLRECLKTCYEKKKNITKQSVLEDILKLYLLLKSHARPKIGYSLAILKYSRASEKEKYERKLKCMVTCLKRTQDDAVFEFDFEDVLDMKCLISIVAVRLKK